MKVRNKAALSCLIAMMALCTFVQAGVFSMANNHADQGFGFDFYADGSDACVDTARRKEDNTASYVKSNAGIEQFSTWIAGSKSTHADPFTSNVCSSSVVIPSGAYRYISNNAYGRFSYVYPIFVIRQDNRWHHLAGKWSPDNISGRY
ncbi:hypothetical protein [Pseudobutyrivibrio sp.]|uniref:hypothetical protein n=1 Tax=Pseudobutyrivibrio sp. TaxID=2014367 RepID=UPI0025D7E915|nr:hypothetical protein [Pseudobutyrivibrio sp.]